VVIDEQKSTNVVFGDAPAWPKITLPTLSTPYKQWHNPMGSFREGARRV